MAMADGGLEKTKMADDESEIEPSSALPTAAGKAPVIPAEGGKGSRKEYGWNLRGRGGLWAGQGPPQQSESRPLDCGDLAVPDSSNGHGRSACFLLNSDLCSRLYTYALPQVCCIFRTRFSPPSANGRGIP